MKAVVTGSEGFIGSHLVDALLASGWSVHGIDDFSTHSGTKPVRSMSGKFTFALRPVQYFTKVPDDTDVIFHLAGKVGPLGVLKYAGQIAHDTIDSARAMADQAEDLGIPMIDVSTSEVYGSPDHTNAEDDPKVFSTASPRQEYAIAKLAAEVMLLNRPDLDVRIIRPFNVAGPRQRPEGGFVLPRFVQQALKDQALTVYGDGSQRRAFTHVKDVVAGILLAYTDGHAGEIYNIGNEYNSITILELAEEVVGQVGSGRVELVNPMDLHGPDFREAPDKVPNSSKARNELEWEPEYSTEEIVAAVVAYERFRK